MQDWRLPLSPDKSISYFDTLRLLETSYSIFSVNLDEAIELRRRGLFSKSHLALSLAPSLCRRLRHDLEVLLQAMLLHAKQFRTDPSVRPLDPENFQLALSRRAAHRSSLCCRVILRGRSQFVHKLSAILGLVADLETVFSTAAGDLEECSSLLPEHEWATLDSVHHDINTCLRESIVLFKCFLHALPAEQLAEFALSLQKQPASQVAGVFIPKRHLAHRRIALLKGQ